MIDRVHFENFKSLQQVTLQLGRLTALVGPNGCGKSSVLRGIHLLSQHALGVPPGMEEVIEVPGTSQRLMYRGRPGNMVLSIRNHDGDELALEASVTAGKPAEETVSRPPTRSKAEEFASVAYLRLDASEMVKTSLVEDETPSVGPERGGLASALAWMKGAAEDEFAQLTSDLRQVVPGVKRIRTLRERIAHRRMEKLDIDGQPIWRPVDESQIGDRFSIEFDDGSEVPADLLSEGTVLALGLLAKLREPGHPRVLLEPGRPRLFLLDDIDRGLHLGAQVKLVETLRALMKLDPELQIVCTTHSPYLLDLFEPDEVRVLALDSERRTHARPLTEHPDFGKWKFGTQTGELWAALGEEWVIAGAAG
ncbi:MAG TPA: ATP-binding protein [Kofleriaceae bacterium]